MTLRDSSSSRERMALATIDVCELVLKCERRGLCLMQEWTPWIDWRTACRCRCAYREVFVDPREQAEIDVEAP